MTLTLPPHNNTSLTSLQAPPKRVSNYLGPELPSYEEPQRNIKNS
jgi:hypothetical protein